MEPRRGGLVRLRTHPHSGVEVPVRPTIHRPVTEGYCVVATQGGELPEVNCQSVTEPLQGSGKVNSIRQADGTSPSGRCEVRAAAQASERGFLREQERPAEQRPWAEETDEPEEKPRRHGSVIGDRMAGSVGEPSRETHWEQTVFMTEQVRRAARWESERPQ